MKKNIAIILILLVMSCIVVAQDPDLERIKNALSSAKSDTSRVLALTAYSSYYKFKRPDSAMFYGAKALTLARQIKFPKGELEAIAYMVLTQSTLGNQAKALQIVLDAIKIAEKNYLIFEKAQLLYLQSIIHNQMKEYEKALSLCMESKNLLDSIHNITFSALVQVGIGDAFLKLNQPDSALYYCQLSYDNHLKEKWVKYYSALELGKIQEKMDHTDLALSLFRESLSLSNEPNEVFNANLAIARLYRKMGNLDSCIYYGEKSLLIAQESKFISNIIDASLFLSGFYEKMEPQKAFQYSKIAIAYKDSLYDLANKTAQETFLGFDEQERQQEIEAAHAEFKNRLWMNAFSGISFTLLVIAIFLFWNSKLKQKAKRNIEKAYNQLKATQAQLIQSEKMASLGELTAGIAHEIQNPLNFVNNFSEVNTELIEEMKQELEKGNMEEVKSIVEDIAGNEKKIVQHGKRADSIVKGMLLHSRKSSGIKEPTDINSLADEFLRLTYHGVKAKDKSFDVTIKNDFDPSIGKINIVAQEMGRVLMNLLNNAFYAVNEKKKLNVDGYEPTVIVSTQKLKDKVEIKVSDNGNGIPQTLLDKIFQPFFTTKPSGEGTGLGLSLSYDIVTKGHGGELKVDTKEGEYTTFIIDLPI